MRCFIALDISDEVRHCIGAAIEKIKAIRGGVRWVPVENIHLTLKFLDEISEAKASEVQQRLSEVCLNHGRFTFSVRGAGGFPDLRRPNILWVGIDESGPLGMLNADIEKAMAGLGFERERRRFAPHLTVGRVGAKAGNRGGLDAVINEWIKLKEIFFGTITVTEAMLMRSALKPAGAEYSKVAGFKLSLQ